ncbi:MAG: T9SS type A sorting domain-containing protein [Saprospiraceae bacterium]|nr:T9SS type A sorting domain-containing protein [Saprospiraceae bacterium]
MQKRLTTFMFLLAGLILLRSSVTRDPSNPPTASTGAPGEQTCGKTNCHSGGSYQGTVTITGVPDTIELNTAYTITLKQTSNAVKGGFELTCLDANNTKCGSLGTGSGCNVTGTTRQYVRQSSAKTLSNGSASWTFQWTSPATISGNEATFYFSSLAANGNGNKSGDNVLLGTKTVVVAPVVNNDEIEATAYKIFPNPVSDVLLIELFDINNATCTLMDSKGSVVLKRDLTNSVNAINIHELANGVYTAFIQDGKKTASKQFVVKH